jgi:dTDP-glucose 4,6-dehydratase
VRYALEAHADCMSLRSTSHTPRAGGELHDEDSPRHTFVHGDMMGPLRARSLQLWTSCGRETDRSILAAGDFVRTDVEGRVLLEAARRTPTLKRFVQISTDEVYGSVPEGSSTETDELRPRNPYAASKAGADRLAYSYWATHDVPVIVTRASNNYGPYQFPEKVIPLFVTNLIDDIPVPLYGDGGNVRDWLHVLDHCRALDLLIHQGRSGEVYNIGGGNEVKNVDLTHDLIRLLGKDDSLIRRVEDRKGHDRRYSVSTAKLRAMGWQQQVPFERGLADTVRWYRENEWWWRPVKERDPQYKAYIEQQYGKRQSH